MTELTHCFRPSGVTVDEMLDAVDFAMAENKHGALTALYAWMAFVGTYLDLTGPPSHEGCCLPPDVA